VGKIAKKIRSEGECVFINLALKIQCHVVENTLLRSTFWIWFANLTNISPIFQDSACDNTPCQNRGTCIPDNSATGYTCSCNIGYRGVNCTEKVCKFIFWEKALVVNFYNICNFKLLNFAVNR